MSGRASKTRPEWAEKVKEVVGRMSNTRAHALAGVSRAYFYSWLEGVVPSRDNVIQFAQGLRWDVNDCLKAAGYELELRPAVSGAQLLFEKLQALERKHPGHQALQYVQLHGGFTEGLTPESAEEIAKYVEFEIWRKTHGENEAPDSKESSPKDNPL